MTGNFAGVAQLVEHLLAKQKVAGSNPVSRFSLVNGLAPVAQLDRAAPFEGEGCRFKSYRARLNRGVAQLG